MRINSCIVCLFLGFIILNYGCSNYETRISKNENIDPKVREDISIIVSKIQQELLEEKTAYLIDLMPLEIRPSFAGIDSFIKQLDITPSGKVKVIDEFFIEYFKSSDQIILESIVENEGYKFQVNPIGKEMYVHLSTVPINNAKNEVLICLIFYWDNSTWKLANINVGMFKYHNNNAFHLLDSALFRKDKNEIIATSYFSQLSSTLMRPSAENFLYNRENIITDFTQEMAANFPSYYQLPLQMSMISTSPSITGYETILEKGYAYPQISYLTKIDIKDIAKLNKENDSIHANITEVFPGINTLSNSIFYLMTDEIGSGNLVRIHKEIK